MTGLEQRLRAVRARIEAAARAAGRDPATVALLAVSKTWPAADVRALAKGWDLPTWDKPATPCLSSRVAYGESVTPERVRMIDQAEQWLRQRGLRMLRVRYHKGDLARIEVPVAALAKLADAATRQDLVATFRHLGFKYVTLDLEGFRSGSLNAMIASDRIGLPTVRLDLTFAHPGFHGDRLDFKLAVRRVGRSSLDMEHRVSAAGMLLWSADHRIVATSADTHKSIPWPDALRAALERHLEATDA